MAQEYLTVSALNKYIKRKFDVDPYLERVYLTERYQISVCEQTVINTLV